jgi:hypothetical protein
MAATAVDAVIWAMVIMNCLSAYLARMAFSSLPRYSLSPFVENAVKYNNDNRNLSFVRLCFGAESYSGTASAEYVFAYQQIVHRKSGEN